MLGDQPRWHSGRVSAWRTRVPGFESESDRVRPLTFKRKVLTAPLLGAQHVRMRVWSVDVRLIIHRPDSVCHCLTGDNPISLYEMVE